MDGETAPAPAPDAGDDNAKGSTPTARPAPTRARSFLRATGLGLASAVLLALADVGATSAWGVRLVFVSLLEGIGVGWAVRRGARGRAGWPYQILATALTYATIIVGHLALLPKPLLAEMTPAPQTLPFLVALPFFSDLNDVFALAMIILGLLQAWRLNARGRRRTRSVAVAGDRGGGPGGLAPDA